MQSGNRNTSVINQGTGSDRTLLTPASSDGNIADITQSGDDGESTLTQNGDNNLATLLQDGIDNVSIITQAGNGNTASVTQGSAVTPRFAQQFHRCHGSAAQHRLRV